MFILYSSFSRYAKPEVRLTFINHHLNSFKVNASLNKNCQNKEPHVTMLYKLIRKFTMTGEMAEQ